MSDNQLSQDKIDELKRRKEEALQGGGEVANAKQMAMGKLTARARIIALLDEDSFHEYDLFAEHEARDFGMERKVLHGDGVIIGTGTIYGAPVAVFAQDFTIAGGSLGSMHARKITKIMDYALRMRIPLIGINDSGGARIQEGVNSLAGYGEIFWRNTISSGVIPQISVIMGPCAGGACYSPAITDYIFMTDYAQMFITGPAVVKSVTGEVITSSDLGGAKVHGSTSGVAHFVYPDDLSCLNGVRQLIGYLPQSNEDYTLTVPGNPVDLSSTLADIVPADSKKAYDVRNVISAIVDENSFFEVQEGFARNIVVGFARFDGETIGIIANQALYMAGSLEINASDKAARFIRFCDSFDIPLLTLVDVPAFLPGSQQEHGGIIRHGAKLLYAYSEATVPKVSLIMRKAYGGAYIAMNSKGIGADVVYAWPIAEIAVMGGSGAVSIIGKKAIEAAEDPAAKREELLCEYNEKFMNPYIAAEHGYVDEVILPEETRSKIASAFNMLKTKDKTLPYKKHGNIPL